MQKSLDKFFEKKIRDIVKISGECRKRLIGKLTIGSRRITLEKTARVIREGAPRKTLEGYQKRFLKRFVEQF